MNEDGLGDGVDLCFCCCELYDGEGDLVLCGLCDGRPCVVSLKQGGADSLFALRQSGYVNGPEVDGCRECVDVVPKKNKKGKEGALSQTTHVCTDTHTDTQDSPCSLADVAESLEHWLVHYL